MSSPMFCLLIPFSGHVGGGPIPPQRPVDPGWGVGSLPIDPGWGQPKPPVDPGWGQGHPIPPHIPIYPSGPVDPGFGVRPPVDPGYGQGHPIGGIPTPPIYYPPGFPTHPIYHPPTVGGGPIVKPPNVIWPQPPPPTLPPQPPGKPQPGIDPIPIGDTGWYLDYWKGAGWVLVPPESSQTPPPEATPK